MHPEPIVDFGIVLAAGGSSRMGHPKALLQLNGQALINAHINALRTHCLELLVVLGNVCEDGVILLNQGAVLSAIFFGKVTTFPTISMTFSWLIHVTV